MLRIRSITAIMFLLVVPVFPACADSEHQASGRLEELRQDSPCGSRVFWHEVDPRAAELLGKLKETLARRELASHYQKEKAFSVASMFEESSRVEEPLRSVKYDACIEWRCLTDQIDLDQPIPREDPSEIRAFLQEAQPVENDCVDQLRWSLARVRLEMWEPYAGDALEFERAIRVLVTGAAEAGKAPGDLVGPASALEDVAFAFAAREDFRSAVAALRLGQRIAQQSADPLMRDLATSLHEREIEFTGMIEQ